MGNFSQDGNTSRLTYTDSAPCLIYEEKFLFFIYKETFSLTAATSQIQGSTDLENLEKSGNLKETSESQGICPKSHGICDRIPKVREKSGNFIV